MSRNADTLVCCAVVIGVFGLARGLADTGSSAVLGFLVALSMAMITTGQLLARRGGRGSR